MNEFWEITHDRGVATQAVWGMQTGFELNNLTRAQHATLTDNLPILAQTRDNKENDLTDTLSAKRDLLAKLRNISVRMPNLLDGMLEDDDPLKDQLDAIFSVDANVSENSALRRARLILPLWTDVNAARAAATPAKPPLTIIYDGATVAVADYSALIDATLAAQKTEAEKQRDVTNAKSTLRTGDRLLDRANKRWYKAWLETYPPETPEGEAALTQITTEKGVSPPTELAILSLTPTADHHITVSLNPEGGKHATTKELQYQLPGETEFGHSTPITSDSLIVGPFSPGVTINFRTRVANSSPGYVVSEMLSAVSL